MNNTKFLPVLLGALLFTASSVTAFAATDSKTDLSKAQKATADKAIDKTLKKQNERQKTIDQNVEAGFEQVKKAITLLNQKDKSKEAIAALEAATGKFDVALAADPKLDLVAIDSSVEIFELMTNSKMVEHTVDEARDLLRDQKVQEARALLLPLRDEMVTTTTYLPMATYPDTIKQAAGALIDGKADKAKDILSLGLSSFVVSESVIPLSMLRAQAFMEEASKLDKDKQKDKIVELLDAAESQVNLTFALGYAAEDSAAYDALISQIKSLRWAVKGPNAAERLYGELKNSFKELIHKEAQPKAAGTH